MTAQIAHQPDPFRHSQKEEQESRVDDYLNDKLQDTADLASIDTLLEDVRGQQALLKQQVLFPLPFGNPLLIICIVARCTAYVEQYVRSIRETCERSPESIQKFQSTTGRYRPPTADCNPIRHQR